MNRVCSLLVLGMALFSRAFGAPELPITYHVQLIRGTHSANPDATDWKPLGPKLSQRLRPVFHWEHYWEVKRFTVTLDKGKVSKLTLNSELLLELEVVSPSMSEIRLLRDGKISRISRQALDQSMTILGGDAEGGRAWFAVVRLDKPE